MIELEPERVPRRLRNAHIVSMQISNVVAGTMLRGMFEERIQGVINEVKERENLILFIDEVHTIIGAGSAMGAAADAANMFKSALGRGELRIIGATTTTEYKEYIAEDEALARRFRTVFIAEPSIEDTRKILQGIRPRLEQNYSVQISDEALETALEMARATSAASTCRTRSLAGWIPPQSRWKSTSRKTRWCSSSTSLMSLRRNRAFRTT